ncbi:calcium permeable stress-gated cation channel [Nematocida sp. AWRm77]|nr:calcium permeable stress-gated cation channel [Nematocida sp. AWRm77]
MPKRSIKDKDTNIIKNVNLASKPSLKDAENAITLNIKVQLCVSTSLFVAFLILRRKLPWMYCANPKRSKKHPAAGYTGVTNWIVPVFSISDSVFFNLVGFDAFLFIETLKLLFLIFLVLSLVVFPALGAYYYFFGQSEEALHFLMQISLLPMPGSQRVANGILPAVSMWVISCGVMYFLYTFYRKYVILRQMHLKDRSFSKSTPSIKRLADDLESVTQALKNINIPSRTVLLQNLPCFIGNKEELLEYLEQLNLGVHPVECYVVVNTKPLEQLIYQRTKLIQDLEMEFQLFFLYLNRLSIDSNFFANTVRGYDNGIDLISNAIAWHESSERPKSPLLDTLEDPGKLSTKQQQQKKQKAVTQMVKLFLSSPLIGTLQAQDAKISTERLAAGLEKIDLLNRKIGKERKRASKPLLNTSDISALVKSSKTHDVYEREKNEHIFLSLSSILKIGSSYKEFMQSIPLDTKNGFVTLSTIEEANLLKISFIGTGTFSCKAIEAPPADEIIWPALTESEAERMLRKLLGALTTFFFVTLFIIFVFLTSTLINIQTFDKIVYWVNPHLEAITKKASFRQTFQAILMPFVYSTLLSLAPTALESICLFEGSISHTEQQKNFGRKYSFFLFVNGFLALIFGTTLASLINSEKEKNGIFVTMSVPVVSSSIFFLNMLIQKTFTGMVLCLLEPGRILTRVLSMLLGGIQTRRKEIEEIEPKKINFGYLYPQVFLTFPMVLIYSVMCPVFILFGALHFFGAYIVYKTLFLYSHVSDIESGGEHWPSLCTNFFYSLVTFQVITIVHFLSLKQYVFLFVTVPLLIITVGVGKNFGSSMEKKCNYLPSSHKEVQESVKFANRLSSIRKEEIKHWVESSLVEKELFLFTKKAKPSEARDSYVYKDLSMHPASSSAILPQWFYTTLCYLQQNGDPDVYHLQE